MLKSFRLVYYKEFFPCVTSMVPGGRWVLGNVKEVLQESVELQVTHGWALCTEGLTHTDLV